MLHWSWIMFCILEMWICLERFAGGIYQGLFDFQIRCLVAKQLHAPLVTSTPQSIPFQPLNSDISLTNHPISPNIKSKVIHLFELSVAIETNGNILKNHQEKLDKYSHFVTDMSGGYKCTVTAFEIGSRGYISTRDQSALYTLHKFTKPGNNLPRFKQNISVLSVYSSYHIFITRK